MEATLTLTEVQVFTAMEGFLTAILPNGTPVLRGQDNRVPEPDDANFVLMTPLFRERIETNVDTYADATSPVGNPSGTRSSLAPTKLTIQLDFHGPASGDNAQIASTLLRDEFACVAFAAAQPSVQPLYASDPRQIPFTDGEQQYEFRWIVEAALQINPVVITQQAFAGTLTPTFIPVPAP